MDWSQFVPGLISTFVAFLLGILGSYLYGYGVRKKESKKVIIELANEFTELASELEVFSNSFYYVKPLKVPFWDNLVSANEISLVKEGIRKDETLFKEILLVQALIVEFNEWCSILTRNYFGLQLPNEEQIVNNRTKIREELTRLKNKLLIGDNKLRGLDKIVEGLKKEAKYAD